MSINRGSRHLHGVCQLCSCAAISWLAIVCLTFESGMDADNNTVLSLHELSLLCTLVVLQSVYSL